MPRIKRVSSTPLPQAKRVKLNRDEPLPKHLCPPTDIWRKIVQHARPAALATLLLVDKQRSAMVTQRVNQVCAGSALQPFGGRLGVKYSTKANVDPIKKKHPLGVFRVTVNWLSGSRTTDVKELRRYSPDAKFTLNVDPRLKYATKALRTQAHWDRVEFQYSERPFVAQQCPLKGNTLAKTSIRELYINLVPPSSRILLADLPSLVCLLDCLPKLGGLESLVIDYPRFRGSITPPQIYTKLLTRCRSLRHLVIDAPWFNGLDGLDLSRSHITSLVIRATTNDYGIPRGIFKVALPPSLESLEVGSPYNTSSKLKFVYSNSNIHSVITNLKIQGRAQQLELPQSVYTSVRQLYLDERCLDKLIPMLSKFGQISSLALAGAKPVRGDQGLDLHSTYWKNVRSRQGFESRDLPALFQQAVAPLAKKGLQTLNIVLPNGALASYAAIMLGFPFRTLASHAAVMLAFPFRTLTSHAAVMLAFPFLNIKLEGDILPFRGFAEWARKTQLKEFLTEPQHEWARPLVQSLTVTDRELIPEIVKACPNLTALDMIGPPPIRSLIRLGQLKELTVREVPEEVNWQGLRLLPSLTRLTLHTENVQFPTPGFLTAIKRCPNLMIVKYPKTKGSMTAHAADTLRNMR